MTNKGNTITAVITDDNDCWNRWKDTQKIFNKTDILEDTELVLEFANHEKHVKMGLDDIKEGSVFDDVRYMKDIIQFKAIKVGMLLVPDLDGFMLGNRWLVKEQREDGSFYAEHYYCGKRDPFVCNDWIIKSDVDCERGFWYQIGEKLEHWQKKFNKIDGKIML